MSRKNPTEEQKEIKKDIGKASAIAVIADMEGGKIIQTGLMKDVVSAIDLLRNRYTTMTMQEFVAGCADLDNKLTMLRVFKNAKNNKKDLAKMLEESFAQEGEDPE